MSILEAYFITLGSSLTLSGLIWVLSLILKDSSIADVFWGPAFVVIAWLNFFLAEGAFQRRILLALLVSIWGLRLALHIALRNRGRGEDPRYGVFRERWGRRYWWGSLFQVFLLQAFLCWVISLSVQAAQHSTGMPGWTPWMLSGAALWAGGFLMQAEADRQLARFRADPGNRGRVLETGLWKYSRHPNYFGEAVMWWAIFLIAAEDPSNLWTLLSPILMTFLLLQVSGVAMLERTISDRRPEYASYIQRTSAFVPWFPKKRGP